MSKLVLLLFLCVTSLVFSMSPQSDPWYKIHTLEDAITAMKIHNEKNELYDGLYVLRILVLKNKFKSLKMQYVLATQYERIVKAYPNDKHAKTNLKHNLQAIKNALKGNKLNKSQRDFYSKFYQRLAPIYNRK
ncbi:MAG: hypothetical protein KC646_11015 [Candidatus Cloacimonetes bacterium]|nr:hypothetical protein [Candidatus Cloacimonadota bacterium]